MNKKVRKVKLIFKNVLGTMAYYSKFTPLYNLMAHFQEKGWLYLIRIRDGKQSMCSSFNLPNTECFDQTFFLTLSRKQTNQLKKRYREFPNDYHFIPHTSTFDFLPETSQKQDPVTL